VTRLSFFCFTFALGPTPTCSQICPGRGLLRQHLACPFRGRKETKRRHPLSPPSSPVDKGPQRWQDGRVDKKGCVLLSPCAVFTPRLTRLDDIVLVGGSTASRKRSLPRYRVLRRPSAQQVPSTRTRPSGYGAAVQAAIFFPEWPNPMTTDEGI